MVQVKDVSFRYKGSKTMALDGINLTIEDGDFVGVIGTSGAGKTTLALSLAGIVPQEFKGDFYGSVLVDGEDTLENGMEHFSKKVGQVFQDIDSQMVASVVEDEILFGLENYGIPHEEIGARLENILRELGIENLRYREIASLSGGQKQKVAIAAILALEPAILVLDEPTGELDPESTREIFGLLKRLNEEKGITIVIVEQKIKLLSEYVRHMVVLNQGKVWSDGIPKDVLKNIQGFKELGINVPPVAELAGKLMDAGLWQGEIPLSINAAEKMVREVLGR